MHKIFKSKIGFTLVELLVVLVIMSTILAIGVPLFRGVGKSARIKNCNAIQRELAQQAKDYCIDIAFNSEFIYKIVSDGEKGTIEEHDTMKLNHEQIDMLTKDTHKNDVLYCPACGTIIIEVIPQNNGTPKIKVTCDGGDDGDCHKESNQ